MQDASSSGTDALLASVASVQADVPITDEAPEKPPDGEPPYSPAAEVKYFFSQGIPLLLANLLEWGVPPLAGMMIAGHTHDSVRLQASLGFARVFYNCVLLMPTNGLNAYLRAVVPGCVGAGRLDRLPRYFHRSMILSLLLQIPSLVLLQFSTPIMRHVGVPADIADGVGEYTRLMTITAVIYLLECQLETLFINLRYTKSDALIGLVTGCGVDVGGFYYLVHVRGLGMRGVAYKEILVKSARVAMWLLLACFFGIWRTLFVPSAAARTEPLLSRRELCIYVSQAVPKYAQNLSGWLIFELQLMALSNIHGMTAAARAAAAVWVQCETALAAAMTGWIQVASMRALKLLGSGDGAGAASSFLLHNALAALVVALTLSTPILLLTKPLSRLASDDTAVSAALQPLLWVLAVHAQSRVVNLTTGALLVPVGLPRLAVGSTFMAFYVVATPIALVGALTDLITHSVAVKMTLAVGCTSIAQTILAALYTLVLCRLDWRATAGMVQRRAQSDAR